MKINENNYLLILEDHESFITIPAVEDYLYDISPSYKYLENMNDDKKKTCICYASHIMPIRLKIIHLNDSINNNYYTELEFNS